MSELEELPSWAGRSADAQPEQEAVLGAEPAETPTDEEPPRRRWPWTVALLALSGVLALLALGGIGYLLASADNDTTEATADQDATDESENADDADDALGSEELQTDGSDASDGDAADQDGAAGDGSGEEGEDTVTVDVDADESADAQDGADGEQDADGTDGTEPEFERQAVVRGGQVFLTGKVPSEEVGKAIEAKAAAVVGPDNVFNQYTIDPSVVIEEGDSGPIYIEEVVLFEFNSVAIAEPFLQLLDLGTLLMVQNPQATMTVITRTDSVGSEEVNLIVSQDRANAVRDYWVSQGVDPDQIILDPRGEELASDSDDAEAAALNRRAEFIITGLLD